MRMIIDDDQTPDAFHILDVQCTIIRPDTITHDEAHARERRAGMYRKDKVPERDENGKLVVGPEVNNTGLDAEGNLVKDRNFDVNVGMTVNVPYSDNGLYLAQFEPHYEKTCLCHMRTTKAQISLRILAV